MNKNYTYVSKLGPYIKDFIALKQSNGYIYKNEKYQLSRFDKFCFENKELDVGTVTRAQIKIWSKQFPNENTNSRNDRMSRLRLFSKYLNSIGIDSFVPPSSGGQYKPIVIVPSVNDLRQFFKYVDNHKYVSNERAFIHINLCYPILFRLLYCCGMRLAEACYLKRSLVNFDESSITILQSKGFKDRKVYFSNDLGLQFKKFDLKMDLLIPNREYMFLGKIKEKPYPKTSVDRVFHQFWSEAFPLWEGRYPTPHSLRHCFVVNKITQWVEEGIDINFMMPYLSKYLGHDNPNETYYYYKNMEPIFPSIQAKDTHSSQIIPEVKCYEN